MEISERNKVIITKIDSGTKISDIARKYGVSRQCIHQIYVKHTGHGNTDIQKQIRHSLKVQKRLIWENQTRFVCIVCQIPVLNRDGKSLQKYCKSCQSIARNKGIRYNRGLLTCECGCREQYYPTTSSLTNYDKGKFKHHYKNRDHYMKVMIESRTGSKHSPEIIEKMRISQRLRHQKDRLQAV